MCIIFLLTNNLREIVMDSLPTESPSDFLSSILDQDERIMQILLKLRRGESNDCQADMDALVEAVGDRKVLIAYKRSKGRQYKNFFCLNDQTIRRLRSLFIHNGEGYTADYMPDIFLKDIYELEIERITRDNGIFTTKNKNNKGTSARQINIANGDIIPTRAKKNTKKASGSSLPIIKKKENAPVARAVHKKIIKANPPEFVPVSTLPPPVVLSDTEPFVPDNIPAATLSNLPTAPSLHSLSPLPSLPSPSPLPSFPTTAHLSSLPLSTVAAGLRSLPLPTVAANLPSPTHLPCLDDLPFLHEDDIPCLSRQQPSTPSIRSPVNVETSRSSEDTESEYEL